MVAKKIAYNTLISAAARVLGTLVALITIGLITRYLSRNDWGEYSIILTLGGIFTVLAELGLYQLLVREISKPGADESKIASNIFTLRLFGGLFIFALAPVVSWLFPYSSQAQWGILLGMVGFWFLSNTQVLVGIFQKNLQMGRVAVAEVLGRLVQLGLVFLFIKNDLGFLPIVLAIGAAGLINFSTVFFMAGRWCRLTLAVDLGLWKKILKESYPLAISGILGMIYFSSDSLFLSFLKPAADVGVYRLPYKILESLIFFPAMFVGLVMPMLTRAASESLERFKKIFQQSNDVLLLFALPLVIGTFFVSPAIVDLLGGGQYSESAAVLNILIIAVGIIFLSTIFSYVVIALEKQKSFLWISATGAIFNVAANLIFIPQYSYYAAAAITLATEILILIMMMIVVYKKIKFLPSWRSGLKSLTAAGLMAMVLWVVGNINLVIIILLGGVVYFGALYLLRGLPPKEIFSLTEK